MERKIGETFEFEGHKLKVVDKDGYGCDGCFFLNRECSLTRDVSGFCSGEYRTDKKRVIFVEAKDEQPQDEQPQELNLCEILKDCPEGTVFWSDNYGKVKFIKIDPRFEEPILTRRIDGYTASYTKEGWHSICFPANCLLWPSRDCRDWTKFTAPWLKKEKFDPKTLKPFDRVLIKDVIWNAGIFSHYNKNVCYYSCECVGGTITKYCIPYNDDTKHLVGTTDEAPEYYRYWEE